MGNSASMLTVAYTLHKPECNVGRLLYWACGYRKNIYCQKIFGNFFSFQATKWFLHQNQWGRIQLDQVVATSWTRVWSPWKWAEMLSELRTPKTTSWPAMHWGIFHPNFLLAYWFTSYYTPCRMKIKIVICILKIKYFKPNFPGQIAL